jgi:hypothetical protein
MRAGSTCESRVKDRQASGVLAHRVREQRKCCGWEQTGGLRHGPGIKAMVNGKITALRTTDVEYEPRYEVEATKAGEYGDRTAFTVGRRRYR